jgi:hypothetical protein
VAQARPFAILLGALTQACTGRIDAPNAMMRPIDRAPSIIGGGIAGLVSAVRVAPMPIAVANASLQTEASSASAQGGAAARPGGGTGDTAGATATDRVRHPLANQRGTAGQRVVDDPGQIGARQRRRRPALGQPGTDRTPPFGIHAGDLCKRAIFFCRQGVSKGTGLYQPAEGLTLRPTGDGLVSYRFLTRPHAASPWQPRVHANQRWR